MFNPFLMMAQCQLAAFDGWMRVANCSWRQYGRMMQLPQELLNHPHYRMHDVCYRGADLDDHYGRRAHDVDIERV